jgi:ComF family protein
MDRLSVSSRKLLYELYHVVWLGVDLLLPPKCGGCGTSGERWCPDCQSKALPVPHPVCESCGTPVPPARVRCADCTHSPPHFRQLRSWRLFDSRIRSALHSLKYKRNLGLSEALVPHLAAHVASLGWEVDVVVPVPLGRGRRNERGYNQAGLIAWPLSLALGITFAPGALRRTRETRSQVGLTRAERRVNVRDAFEAKPSRVAHRNVMLVDDVATTGATLSSCAEALHAAGARDVFALTVARAHRGPSGDA